MNAVRSATRAACCMLWVTITIVTRALSSIDQLLDLQRRDRVERRAGLVHQDHLGVDRERAGDAQPLLLAAGETRAGLVQPVGDLLPQPGAAQRRFDLRRKRGLGARLAPVRGQAQAGGDVVEHRHRRERVGLLEDHPDRAAHRDDVDRRVVHVELVQQHASLGAGAGDLLVHAVDAAHHRRLATARRSDDRRDLVGAELEVDPLDLLGLAVEGAQALQAHAEPGLGQR